MTLRIIKTYSNENGKLLGYRLQERLFPFVWRDLREYPPDRLQNLEHDIVFLLKVIGSCVKETEEFV